MPGVEGTLMCMLVANGDSADNGRLDAMMKVRNRRGLELLRKIRDKHRTLLFQGFGRAHIGLLNAVHVPQRLRVIRTVANVSDRR